MYKEVADKWVAALRSGKYTQAKSVLRRQTMPDLTPGFCCLGVLCDISGVGKWDEGDYYVCGGWPTTHETSNVCLTSQVKEWAGMTSYSGTRDHAPSLASMNDRGATFEEIAQIIEKEWETL